MEGAHTYVPQKATKGVGWGNAWTRTHDGAGQVEQGGGYIRAQGWFLQVSSAKAFYQF